jgi:hypothetical protein
MGYLYYIKFVTLTKNNIWRFVSKNYTKFNISFYMNYVLQYLIETICLNIYDKKYTKCALFLFFIMAFRSQIKKGIQNTFIHVCNRLIFKPLKINEEKYNTLMSNPNVIHEIIETNDNVILDAFLYNKDKIPSYQDDIIFLYSHGNAGWLGSVFETTTFNNIVNYGTIFVYDYRGYGKSKSKNNSMKLERPSEKGCFMDCVSVYDYLIKTKNVNPKRIILFGHSMGACTTLYLMKYILENEKYNHYPSFVILQSSFENIQRVCNDIVPILGKYVISDLKNDLFIEKIDNICLEKLIHLNICIIHSNEDDLINIKHSLDLTNHIKHINKKMITVSGPHGAPVYNEETTHYFFEMCESIRSNANNK